jgi:hypothetical protein
MSHWLRLTAVLLLPLIVSCAGIDPQAYSKEQPPIDLRRYFDGALEGHGLFVDRSGRVTRRFVVTVRGEWKGEIGTLNEDFVWSDGERETRVWTLTPLPDQPGRWRGTAANVIGEARGTVAGNALNWKYGYALKTRDGSSYNIDFDDWMFRIDEKVVLNRAVLTFWGLKVGEVLISFRRVGG